MYTDQSPWLNRDVNTQYNTGTIDNGYSYALFSHKPGRLKNQSTKMCAIHYVNYERKIR